MKLSAHFWRKEFACKCGCGLDTVDYELLLVLEEIRAQFGRKVYVTSGCRCEKYNKEIKGYPRSKHLVCKAADIVVDGVDPVDVADFAETLLVRRGGIGRYESFTHVDVRDNMARWKG